MAESYLKQLKTLGASCDWDRTAFTMDKVRSEAVIRVFIDMYKKGKLYRGLRMINWDPEAKTVLSNEEVIYHEEQTSLYHVKYEVVDENGKGLGDWVTVATTRPETILGDTAIAVHPKDKKYKHLIGKSVNVPLINRIVPIIFDEYVDREFGTGALKITPAHDVNDYEIGKKHNLETIDQPGEPIEIDQLADLVEQIRTNPDSRRLLLSAWNVGEIDAMKLPPCHLLYPVQRAGRSAPLRDDHAQLRCVPGPALQHRFVRFAHDDDGAGDGPRAG